MGNVKYTIGYDLFPLIPAGIMLTVFLGVTIFLKLANNGMFIFTGLLSLIVIAIALTVLYAYFFKKIIVDETGFYYRNGIIKGRYYRFTEISEAWESKGKSQSGIINYYFNFKTANKKVEKFVFTADKAEGIDYLISRVMGEANEN